MFGTVSRQENRTEKFGADGIRSNVTEAIVACRDCCHFERNKTNPPDGMGQCLQRQPSHPDRGQWPGHESLCRMHEKQTRE